MVGVRERVRADLPLGEEVLVEGDVAVIGQVPEVGFFFLQDLAVAFPPGQVEHQPTGRSFGGRGGFGGRGRSGGGPGRSSGGP